MNILKNILRIIAIAFIVSLYVLLSISPVFAVTAQPNSTPSIDKIYVQRNLINTGDILYVAQYNIPYASPPTDTIDTTFNFQLLGTDGSTLLGTILAYSYNARGYGKGAVSWYFDVGHSLVWGSAYTIRIAENPLKFTSPVVWNFPVPSTAYDSSDNQATNRLDLATNVLSIANALQTAWSVTLLSASEGGQVLSGNGEVYFRDHAIQGLYTMAPTLFLIQINNPTYSTRSWGTNQATTYENRFSNTWVQTALNGVGTLFNVQWNFIGAFFILAVCMAFMYLSITRLENSSSGFLSSIVAILAGGLLGWIPMAMVGILTMFCAIYLGMLLILKGGW